MAAFLHDAVLLYVIALNRTISQGLDARSGQVVFNNMRLVEFPGT